MGRRPVAQRGQTPRPEQERKATDNPNRDVVGCDRLRERMGHLHEGVQQRFSLNADGEGAAPAVGRATYDPADLIR